MSSRAEQFKYSFLLCVTNSKMYSMLSHRSCLDNSSYKLIKRLKKKALWMGNVLFFRRTPGTISCPICLDSYCEVTFNTSVAHLDEWLNSALWLDCWCLQIVESGRLVVSTKCGHVFCSQCLTNALASSCTCPTCRKRLTQREYHPLYVWRHRMGSVSALQFFVLFSLFRI